SGPGIDPDDYSELFHDPSPSLAPRRASAFSIRRSGMSHMTATIMNARPASDGRTNASGMAAAYSTSDTIPLESSPTAVTIVDSRPCNLINTRTRMEKATPAHNCTMAYSATGTDAKWVPPIQAVTNGVSESQNKRCMLAHSTAPLTRWHA